MNILGKRTLKIVTGVIIVGFLTIIGVLIAVSNTKWHVKDITEVQNFEYVEPSSNGLEKYSMALNEYFSRNPVYMNEIINQRQEDADIEYEVKQAEKEMFAHVLDEYESEVQKRRMEEILDQRKELHRTYEVYDAYKFYIPNIKLDYPAEQFNFDYEHQAYLYSICQELNIDYFLMMGIIARESRFTFSTRTDYCGYMGVGAAAEENARKETGDYSLSRWNEYDNLYIGCYTYAGHFAKIGNDDGALLAYHLGYQGYLDAIAQGIYTNSDVKKAWKFRELLLNCERYEAP